MVELTFQLPVGYVDGLGGVHRDGRLRLARALDEIEAMANPRVLANEAYLPVAVLARVVVALGTLAEVTEDVVAGLALRDFAFLEQLYLELNGVGATEATSGVRCPHCAADVMAGRP